MIATPLSEQLHAAREDELRVLIVGAGVAGVALAQLLRRHGLHPVLVERSGPEAAGGYMLGLMPLVDPVLGSLGVEQEYLDQSVGMHRYRLHASTGQVLAEYSLDELLGEFGRYRGIERGALLRTLASGGAPVSYHATVTSLVQSSERVHAVLTEKDNQQAGEFDVMVAADGIHSGTRDLVLSPKRVTRMDTRWGGWVAWAGADTETDVYAELWGAGFILGTYPVSGHVGVFLGGDRSITTDGVGPFISGVRKRLRTTDARTERALAAVAAADEPFYWPLADTRCRTWTAGRVVLLGDAAAGFLPTAGIGAAMALESAAVLAPRLTTTRPGAVPQALGDFERAQRPRVESAHGNSRRLAQLMFRSSDTLARLRDTGARRFLTPHRALGPIRRLHQNQPAGAERPAWEHPARGGWRGRTCAGNGADCGGSR